MSCCCDLWCTTRNYEPDGSANWQGPGSDGQGSSRQDIAIDSSGNAYTVSGGIEKLDNTGAQVWSTPAGTLYHQGLRCICLSEDEAYAYVGSRHVAPGPFGGGFSGNNIFKVRLSDQVVVADASIGSWTITVDDCVADGSGGVYFATSEGVFHRDSSFNAMANVGCNARAEALAKDDGGNLWVVGEACTVELDNGCDVEWSVRKYNSVGDLVDGTTFIDPRAVAWRDGFVYVGYRNSGADPCNVVKFDDVEFVCEWTHRVSGSETGSPFVEDIAVNADGVYMIAGQYLYALNDADGTKDWCRKNEGLKPDGVTKKAGTLRAVAVGQIEGSNHIWVTGQATPCNDQEEDACFDTECEDKNCVCDCGEAGRTGGTLVNCDCDEVPCEFTSPVTSVCEGLDGAIIHWQRNSEIRTRWHGTLNTDCGSATFVVNFDCAGSGFNGWSIVPSGVVSSVTITQSFCTDDAPAGFSNPGFIGTMTFGSGACDECEGCLAFGTDGAECPPATVDLCSCTGIPTTLTATITVTSGTCANVAGDTATLTYNGSTAWTGTASTGCTPDIGITLTCSGGSWSMDLTPSECFVTAGGGTTGTCSPFQQARAFTWINSGSCACCATATQITVTVTA